MPRTAKDRLADKLNGGLLNATDPDLKPFLARGGRLLLYHGWSDPLIAPGNTVNYYRSVLSVIGSATKAADFVRLFMIPGMRHCGNGDGTSVFDRMSAIEQWVEKGQPPDRIIARRVDADGKTDRTRPLCPYPAVATYTGTGSIDDAANFVCKAPQ